MDGMYVNKQKQAELKKIDLNYEEQQKTAWDTVENYRKGSGKMDSAKGAKYHDLDNKSLFELRDEMFQDTDSKSELFKIMYDNINLLAEMSITKGKKTDEEGETLTADFFEVLFAAKKSVEMYLSTHSGFRWSDKGERRVEIAGRLNKILTGITKEVDAAQANMSEKKARMVDYDKEHLTPEEIEAREAALQADKQFRDVFQMARSGIYGTKMSAEDAKKAGEIWVIKGYSEKLKEMVNNSGAATDSSKLDDFLAFLDNKNNCIIANRMAVSIMSEESKSVTLGMPWMQEQLRRYIEDKLTDDDMMSKTTEFTDKLREVIKNYQTENKDIIEKQAARRDAIASRLHIPVKSSNMYEYPKIKELILETDETEFNSKLANLEESVKASDKLIINMIKSRYSVGARKSISKRLVLNLGALRAFGTTEQILNQTNIFLEMLKYTAPKEYLAEITLSNVLSSLGIEEIYRDEFVRSVTDNNPEVFIEYSAEFWKVRGEKFSKQHKANMKALTKNVDKKGLMLTEKDWDKLEEMGKSAGVLTKDEFNEKVKDILDNRETGGETLSREEYLSKRKFRDAQKEPVRILRAKAEQERIDGIGDKFKDLFMVHFTNTDFDIDEQTKKSAKENQYLQYRRLNAALRGEQDKLKVDEANEEQLYKERISHVKHTLQSAGIPKDKWDKYVTRCRWLISGIRDTDENMTDDERLKIERLNLERFGVRSWDEALDKFAEAASLINTAEGETELKKYEERYKMGRRMIDEYDGGKYKEFTDSLVTIPEVYRAMMDMEADQFENFCLKVIDKKLGSFMEGARRTMRRTDEERSREDQKGKDREIILPISRKQFAYANLKNIYEGRLTGDADFFEEQLRIYDSSIYKIKPDGQTSLNSSLTEAQKALSDAMERDAYYKRGKRSTLLSCMDVAMREVFSLFEDAGGFLKFFEKGAVKKLALDAYKKARDSVQDGVEKDVTKKITHKFEDKRTDEDIANDKGYKKAVDKRRSGLKPRYNYLLIDEARLEKVRLGKSLVRVGEKGSHRVDLKTSKADTMRGRIQKYAGNFDLPPVLRDALVEEGATEQFGSRFRGIMWDNAQLISHAFAMNKMYEFLRHDTKNEPGMTDEEAQMYIVRCYSNPDMREELFENKTGPNVSALRKTGDYKTFRANYAKLMAFEATEVNEPSLEDERIEMSRNLRAMLVTGIGILDENGKSFDTGSLKTDSEKAEYQKKLGTVIENSTKYMQLCIKVNDLIRKEVEADDELRNIRQTEHNKNRKVYAVRAYFLKEIVEQCKNGTEFKEEDWKAQIKSVHEDKYLWDNMLSRRNTISSSTINAAEKSKIESAFGEAAIAEAIKQNTYLFKGRVNKYESLDEDQKKFFALALMMMDKGAIGMGTAGTSALLASKSGKATSTAAIEAELNKYIAGEPYHLEIDYKEAFNKLVNYGETKVFYMEGYALSVSAYNKALQFARSVTAKKIAFGERDDERLNNGYASILAAHEKYDTPQKIEVDKLRDEYLTFKDVKARLIEYANKGMVDKKTIATEAVLAGGAHITAIKELDRDLSYNKRLTKIHNRLVKMNDEDMKLFIRIMQSRSILDKTTMDRGEADENGENDIPEYADQERRNALLEALCGDPQTSASVLNGFDDSESCFQAMVNALSFQLRDDLNFKGKALTKDMFAKGALQRRSMIDWQLLENAFAFMDEVKERRASIYALRHSSDFIEQSGNEKAIAENKKIEEKYKNKEDFTRENFEDYIKEQCSSDGGGELDRLVAGYHSLTDKEKNLFFKVLGRRDLLDISRKNYKKSFFGMADRNYVNQAERDKLMDQYIDSSLEDNVGIQLQPGEHFAALKSLFSTQISDREKFDSTKKLSKMMAVEKNLFFGRSTAVDWKLFRRALNFVNRASEELEYREGNAQLYRGAGLLSETGRMSMNYSFLRKNFHRTGNQWGRYLGRLFVRTVREELGVDDKLKLVLKNLKLANDAANTLGFDKNGFLGTGVEWLNKQATDIQGNLKKTDKQEGEFNITAMKVAEKKKTQEEEDKEKQEEKERRDNLLYFEALKEGVDNVMAQAGSALEAATEVTKFIRDNFATRFEATKFLTETKDIGAEEDKNNLVVKMTKNAKEDETYGDSRDTIKKGKKTYNTITGIASATLKVTDLVPEYKAIHDIVQYASEKAVYMYINENILKNHVDIPQVAEGTMGDLYKAQASALKEGANKYVHDFMEGVFRDVVGNDFADTLKDLEGNYYSNIKTIVEDQIKAATDGIKYAKKCVKHITNVANAAKNIIELKNIGEIASKNTEADNQKLETAKLNRLSPEQAAKVDRIVKKHRAMSGMAGEIATAIQSFNIAEDVINLTFETLEIAGQKLNPGQDILAKSIKAGIEFAMFAIRIATDRAALNRYFIDTDAGNEVVDKVKAGFIKAGNKQMADKIDARRKAHKEGKIEQYVDANTSLVDLISDARGYEHTSELVENTGMSLAQSIVFSASRYNPMVETRLTAITVMSVMGLSKEIGDTSPKTVEKLFESFRMKR